MLHDIAAHSFRNSTEHRSDDGTDVPYHRHGRAIGRQYSTRKASSRLAGTRSRAAPLTKSTKAAPKGCSLDTRRNFRSMCVFDWIIYEPFRAMRHYWRILIGSNDRMRRFGSRQRNNDLRQGVMVKLESKAISNIRMPDGRVHQLTGIPQSCFKWHRRLGAIR